MESAFCLDCLLFVFAVYLLEFLLLFFCTSFGFVVIFWLFGVGVAVGCLFRCALLGCILWLGFAIVCFELVFWRFWLGCVLCCFG